MRHDPPDRFQDAIQHFVKVQRAIQHGSTFPQRFGQQALIALRFKQARLFNPHRDQVRYRSGEIDVFLGEVARLIHGITQTSQ